MHTIRFACLCYRVVVEELKREPPVVRHQVRLVVKRIGIYHYEVDRTRPGNSATGLIPAIL